MANDDVVQLRPRRRKVPLAPLHVDSISVKGLFDKLDYPEIRFRNSAEEKSRVSVIYGDNGTGKTSILRLLYACLSHQSNAGLRTLVAQTPFKKFRIALSDGTEINVSKQEVVGSYEVKISRPDAQSNFSIEAGADARVGDQESIVRLEAELTKIGFDILFVDHNRVVQSTYSFLAEAVGPAGDSFFRWNNDIAIPYLVGDIARIKYNRLKENDLQFPLPQVVDAVEKWFRNEAFRQGATGEQNAAAVYLEIARALGRGRPKNSSEPTKKERDIPETLNRLSKVTESYIKHGLLSSYPFTELAAIYQNAPKGKKDQIEIAINPFLDSIERRLDALSKVHDSVTVFENELSKYFIKKSADFHILRGLTISNGDSKLRLDSLSSGEKQLVFLLCSAAISKSSRSLILIDEPELSLNYKWQRQIAQSLSNISSSSNTQFILASHSIEIITRYVNSSVELTS